MRLSRSGNDGPWSTFLLGYGTPAQYIESYISTSAAQPYVILPGGCISGDQGDCSEARGGFFLPNQSSTWQSLGDFTLESEVNLGINDAGDFGYDTVTLGLLGSNGPSLENQVVVGIIAKDFFLAAWGLRPAPTNFTTLNDPIPSVLESLKEQGEVSSLSWGYTAGPYQLSKLNKNSLGSLTIGGYDMSRFQPNDLSFDFAPNTSRDLVVAILSISTAAGSTPLLGKSILSFLDSGVSHIWLPESSCQLFQNAFNLTYDENLGLYLVNETVHDALLAQNASISFTLSNDLTIYSSTSPITIELPYSAFDLELTLDYPNNSDNVTYYFPIRRATNDSQYTLGRPFFQHAYVIADYERSIFSVHQASFPEAGAQQNLQTIPPVAATNSTTSASPTSAPSDSDSRSLPIGALAGIIIAVIVVFLATILGVWWSCRKRRRSSKSQRALSTQKRLSELEGNDVVGEPPYEVHAQSCPTPELPPTTYARGGIRATEKMPLWEVKAERRYRPSLERDADERVEMAG